jgi:hypothetical protein
MRDKPSRVLYDSPMSSQLQILHEPKLTNATLLLALTGGMDGGSVSTGTVRLMRGLRELNQIARLQPVVFYI